MARPVSKAGKGGGDSLAELNQFISTFENIKKSNAEGSVNVAVSQKVWNTYTRKTKTEIGKAYIKMSSRYEAMTLEAIKFNISNPVWGWPRTTKRYNGQTVSSPRDIVDTGALLRSTKIATRFTQKGFTVEHSNSAPHAGIVHYGGYVRSPNGARTFLPARPWASIVWKRVPPGTTSYTGVRQVNLSVIAAEELKAAIARAST